jgi:hypothetical protein
MEEKIIPVVSKDIKFLNDINQVVKKSFLRYFIARNGVVFTNDDGKVMDNGIHFSFIEDMDKIMNLIGIPERHILMLDSAEVYTHFKDQKKFIKYLKINDQGIFISGEEKECRIGALIDLTDSMESVYKSAVDRILKNDGITISNDDIEKLLKNEVVTYGEGDTRVRVTKTLIPHIKLDLPITITFLDVENPDLFETMISITKDNITNFHVYTCIKF